MSALNGLRVIDFGQYLAGPLVAQMLADHGAEVVRVDPPGGPRWRSEANAILQRGKRSIVLDLHDLDDRRSAQRLIASADVVVENFRPGVMDRLGVGADACCASNPRLIYCSLPGFASDDPRAGVFAHEGLIGSAAGLHGSRDLDPEAEPIYNTLPLASCYAALIASNSIVAALIARERTGLGQRIEVSLFDACFELTRYYADRLPGAAYPRRPLGGSRAMALTQHYVCRDGRFVHLSWLEEDRQLKAFARLTGLEQEWTREGLLDHTRVRTDFAYSERLRAALADVFRTRTAAEWMGIANPDADLAECLTTEEWLRWNDHARVSRAVISLDDPEYGRTEQAGYPVTMSRTPPQARGPRQPLDADRESILRELAQPGASRSEPGPRQSLNSALEGVRALDLTQVLAGPTACRILAEYGAEVVQVANPWARAGRDYHLSVNSGKRTILLDLKKPGAMEVFWALIDRADVVSTNFSSDVGERLGVDEVRVRQRRPDIVYSRISAYGLEGPLRAYRGHEQVGQAVTGMQVRWGKNAATPLMQPHPVNDFGTGHLAAFAILLALFHRLRTGEGQMVGASLAQTATLLQTPFMLAFSGKGWAEPGGQACRGLSALTRLYRARDGWLFLAARGADELANVAGLQQLDVSHIEADLEARMAEETAAGWVERLTAAGVGAHLLNTPAGAMADVWATSHGVSRSVTFPEAGPGVIVGPALRLSLTPMRPGSPTAPLGWHARELLDELGFGDRMADLVEHGAVPLPN